MVLIASVRLVDCCNYIQLMVILFVSFCLAGAQVTQRRNVEQILSLIKSSVLTEFGPLESFE